MHFRGLLLACSAVCYISFSLALAIKGKAPPKAKVAPRPKGKVPWAENLKELPTNKDPDDLMKLARNNPDVFVKEFAIQTYPILRVLDPGKGYQKKARHWIQFQTQESFWCCIYERGGLVKGPCPEAPKPPTPQPPQPVIPIDDLLNSKLKSKAKKRRRNV